MVDESTTRPYEPKQLTIADANVLCSLLYLSVVLDSGPCYCPSVLLFHTAHMRVYRKSHDYMH